MNYFELKTELQRLNEAGSLAEFTIRDYISGLVLVGWTGENGELFLVEPKSKKKDWALPFDKVISKHVSTKVLISASFVFTFEISTYRTDTFTCTRPGNLIKQDESLRA